MIGDLHDGQSDSVEVWACAGKYTGHLNKKNQAHGKGNFTGEGGEVIDGTFFNNHMEGYCQIKFPQGKMYIGEMKASQWHGRVTVYE